MSEKHTPGPWKPEWQSIINAARNIEARVQGEAWKDKAGEFEGFVDANARLIANAPDVQDQRDDLLSACRKCIEAMDRTGQRFNGLGTMRAAIEKAEQYEQ